MSESGATKPLAIPADRVRMHEESLKGALIFRAKDNREKRWKLYIQQLAHNWTGGKAETDTPVVNIVSSRTRSIPPRLAFNAPNFQVTSYGPAPTPNSEAANAAFLKMLWEVENVDAVAKQVTLDWPATGLGIAFVGYEKADEGSILEGRRTLAGLATKEFIARGARIAGRDIEASREQRAVRFMQEHRIFVERVSPLNFALDPCGSSVLDCQHMWRRVFLPYDQAQRMLGKKCPPPDSVNNVAIYGDSGAPDPFGDHEDSTLKADLPDSVKRVPLWEGWNITTRETVYHDRWGKFLVGFDWRSPHPDFPFELLLWDIVPDVVYPEGLMAAGNPLNNELHLIRKRELSEANKAIGKYTGPADISEDALAALLSGVDGAYVPRRDGDEPIEPLQRAPMPAEFWLLEDRIKSDFDQITNTTAYDAGGMPQVRRTATEAAFSQSSSDATMAMRQLAVESWASRLGDKMLAVAHVAFAEPIPILIPNSDEEMVTEDGDPVGVGTPFVLDFIPIDHAGYYRTTVTSGSMASNAKDVELAQMAQMATLYINQPWFKSREFARAHLGLLTSVKDPSRFIADDTEMAPPDPNEQTLEGAEALAGAQGQPTDEAGILASMFGSTAPMTGDNGMGGANMGTTDGTVGPPIEGM